MKKRYWLPILVLAVVGIVIYYVKRAGSVVQQKLGSDGVGGHKPPRESRGERGADPDQPAPVAVKSKVVITFSQLAACAPPAAAAICKTVQLTALSSVLSYTGRGSGYSETGIRQTSKPAMTFWTWVNIGLAGISELSKAMEEDGNVTEEPGLVPAVLEFARKRFSWRDCLNNARTSVAFEVSSDQKNAADFVLKSALGQEIRAAEELSAVAAKLGTTASIIKLLSTKVVT